MFSLREHYSNTAQSILDQFGDENIIEMVCIRDPIPNLVKKFLDYVSAGQSKIAYDELYHLALLVRLQSDHRLIIEKNEEININKNFSLKPTTQHMKIDLRGKQISLKTLMDNTQKRMGTKNYFTYDAFTLNCQNFIKNILEANGLWKPQYQSFIYQDMGALIKSVPTFQQKVMKGITNFKAYFNKLIGTGEHEDDSNMG